jgi:hypothetical protein
VSIDDDPIVQIRRRAFWSIVALALMAWDLHAIRRFAAKAREQRGQERAKWARERNDLDEVHLNRVSELQGQVRRLREQLGQDGEPAEPAT